MADALYCRILEESLQKYSDLFRQREELDSELSKLRQFIHATANMLPDEDRRGYQPQLSALASQTSGLTEAVRDALRLVTADNSSATATQIRDRLVQDGFDFARYTSNPLASVNTVLRRFKPGEVKTGQTERGVTTYQWRDIVHATLKVGQVVKRAQSSGSAGKPKSST